MKKEYAYLEKFIKDFDRGSQGKYIIIPIFRYFLGRYDILTSSFIACLSENWGNFPEHIRLIIKSEIASFIDLCKDDEAFKYRTELWLDLLNKGE